MRNRHLDDGTLRAHLDGELTPLASLCVHWHVWRCAICRHALSEQRELHARSAALLSALPRPIDVEAGWRRVSARYGGTRRQRPALVLAWSLGVGVLMLAAAVGVARLSGWSGLAVGPAQSVGEYVRDVCCFDLDGGGPGDDGVFTLSGRDQRVDCVLVYDDLDRSRALSAGDRMRFVSRKSGCKRAITARVAMVTGGTMVASLASSVHDASRRAAP